MIRATALLAILLLLPSSLPAYHVVHQLGPARLELSCDNQRDDLALSDLLTLTLTLDADAPIQVEAWKVLLEKSAWAIVERQPILVSKTATNEPRWQLTVLLAPTLPGDAVPLEIAPLRWKQGGGDWRTAAWPKSMVKVTTQIRQPDVKSLREATSIEELPTLAEGWNPRWLWLLALPLVVAAVVFGLRRRQTSSRLRDPYRDATRALDRLSQRRLPEMGRSERFATQLTLVLRLYLERRCGLPARRLTSAELVNAVRQSPSLASHAEPLEQLLSCCDKVKYARADLAAGDCEKLTEQARQQLAAWEAVMTGNVVKSE